jgi:transposase
VRGRTPRPRRSLLPPTSSSRPSRRLLRAKRGGQPGHPKHERALVGPERVNAFFDHPPPGHCPDCGQALIPSGCRPLLVQQVDLRIVPLPLHVEEHRCHEAYCRHCDHTFRGRLPDPVRRGGLLGANLTALVAYLKGVCHASFGTIRTFLRDVVGLGVSRGQLAKVINKVSLALEAGYQELLDDLPRQATLNVDETSHKNNGELFWTWCFRAELYTLFHIDPTRSADVLLKVLGQEFDGALGCDFYAAYRRFMGLSDARLPFCLAHLVREVKFLCTLPDPLTRAYGERFRQALGELFAVIHQREQCSQAEFKRRLEGARDHVLWQASQAPATAAARRLAARLEKFGEGYFEFLTTPGLGPTNHAAEQAIRFVGIDRKVTQGTRSETGQRWCERIWSVVASCRQQGRSVWEYLQQAVAAWFAGQEGPSLIPLDD